MFCENKKAKKDVLFPVFLPDFLSFFSFFCEPVKRTRLLRAAKNKGTGSLVCGPWKAKISVCLCVKWNSSCIFIQWWIWFNSSVDWLEPMDRIDEHWVWGKCSKEHTHAHFIQISCVKTQCEVFFCFCFMAINSGRNCEPSDHYYRKSPTVTVWLVLIAAVFINNCSSMCSFNKYSMFLTLWSNWLITN